MIDNKTRDKLMTLEMRDVTKRVGAEIHIHETSLTFLPGRFNVLLGETNAGKTTLMKLMAGLDHPTSGQVLINGVDVTKRSTQERQISFVHQFFVNYPHLSVYENIASPLRLAKLSSADIDRRVREAAELMKLTPMLTRRPQELSGGQQQRTALARAIVKESKVVFLDEPLANLDYKLREELRLELPQLFADRGAVVVYATSEPAEALMLGGCTATLHEGHVSQFGETSNVYRKPVNLTTAQVFSDPPLNTALVTKQGNRCTLNADVSWELSGVQAQLDDGEYSIGVRPHHVLPTAITNGVEISGSVQVTELSGSESVAHFRVGQGSWVSQSEGIHPYQVGESHTFFMDVSKCFFFATDGRLVA